MRWVDAMASWFGSVEVMKRVILAIWQKQKSANDSFRGSLPLYQQ